MNRDFKRLKRRQRIKTKTADWDFQAAIDFALKRLKKKGKVMPTFMAYKGDKQCHVFCNNWDNDNDKHEYLTFLKMAFKALEVDHYIMLSEAWAVLGRNEKDIEKSKAYRPSQHPDRVDALIIASISRQRTRMKTYIISKDKKVELKEEYSQSGMQIEGSMMELLAPEDAILPEELKENILDLIKRNCYKLNED